MLIVSGDDFGVSTAVNQAIIRAHRQGILTSASLMVNGAAFEDAVRLAKENPRLGVGIHLAVVRSRATLTRKQLPNLLDARNDLPKNPVLAGLQYFFSRPFRVQIEAEITAQVQKFLGTGLIPSHIDGHLHFHVHPSILPLVLDLARRYDVPAVRIPRESLSIDLQFDGRDKLSKLFHAFVFKCLGDKAAARAKRYRVGFPDRFHGLLSSGRIIEDYLAGVLARLPAGVTEIGTHPAVELPEELRQWAAQYQYHAEMEALLSPRIAALIRDSGIQLVNFNIFRT